MTEIKNKEKVLLVGLDLYSNKVSIEKSMDELEELVYAAGGIVISRVIQKRDSIDVTYFIGRGKVAELKNYCEELDIDTVVFNDELSGAQLRNLEDEVGRKIVDRTNLILDIFANRARSKEGKLQVELAQMKYRLPRLIGYRDYLSREGGGIGTRGPGEQKLELDRRIILKEISKIERELKNIEKSRDVKRKRRAKSSLPIVSLVGYTNAGKSTILNSIIERNSNYKADKKVFTKDMLFATLDTSLREASLNNGQKFLITDTVGFVDKLPTHLVEAFKGTLEEVRYSDLIVHVVDASDENIDLQMEVTRNILDELNSLDKPILTVFNKIDLVEDENVLLETSNMKDTVYISALKREGINDLVDMIEYKLPQKYREVSLLIPYTDQELVDYFLASYKCSRVEYLNEGTAIDLSINELDYKKYEDFIVG